MKVAISTVGKFHCFDLARELHAHSALEAIFTGYPRFKLRNEQLPAHKIRTFPYLQAPFMALRARDRLGARFVRDWAHWAQITLDSHVARNLPDCDVFVGLSGGALQAGRAARRRGIRHVCDRGSSHIRTQDALLREEHERWGLPFDGVDPRSIEREEAEYEMADAITVPSSFVLRSFLERGVPAAKLKLLPYGVNLTTFTKVAEPDPDTFDVLFVGGMSLRKGVPYLLQAFRRLRHPRKTLTFAGSVAPKLIGMLKQRGLWPDEARVLGHVPQAELKQLMSRSHVMVLPSIEEGLALVQAQAMACGCVVIGTPNTGAEDLLTDGVEGFVVPIRALDDLADRLQRLVDSPALRNEMSRHAIARVALLGGWRDYGRNALTIYGALVGTNAATGSSAAEARPAIHMNAAQHGG